MININIGFNFFFVVAVSFVNATYWFKGIKSENSNQRTDLKDFQ